MWLAACKVPSVNTSCHVCMARDNILHGLAGLTAALENRVEPVQLGEPSQRSLLLPHMSAQVFLSNFPSLDGETSLLCHAEKSGHIGRPRSGIQTRVQGSGAILGVVLSCTL